MNNRSRTEPNHYKDKFGDREIPRLRGVYRTSWYRGRGTHRTPDRHNQASRRCCVEVSDTKFVVCSDGVPRPSASGSNSAVVPVDEDSRYSFPRQGPERGTGHLPVGGGHRSEWKDDTLRHKSRGEECSYGQDNLTQGEITGVQLN